MEFPAPPDWVGMEDHLNSTYARKFVKFLLHSLPMEVYVMNTLWIVVIAAVIIYVAYNFYAKVIDRNVIKTDAKKATPAKMYMDGVDFMPTNRNVLYGYHFKSIAAAGPIVGVITAANLWGWLPALI